jgi:four helix bundle protein
VEAGKESYRGLVIWQKAKELVLQIYTETNKFPQSEVFGLTSQLRRAVLSIPVNIAEGKERQYDKEFVQFLHVARGSLAEVEVFLEIAKDLGYLAVDKFNLLENQAAEVGKLINGLINSLK